MSIKKKMISSAVAVIVIFGVWTLLDYLYSTFISRSGFSFDVGSNLIAPLVIGVLVVCVLIPMYDKDMDKARAKYEGVREIRHHKAPKEEK